MRSVLFCSGSLPRVVFIALLACVRPGFAEAAIGPVLSAPLVTQRGANQATFTFQSDSTGLGYFTLLAGDQTSAPGTGAQVVAATDAGGSPALRFGSLPLTAGAAANYTVRNLAANTVYTVCFTASDGVNVNGTPKATSFTTAVATPLTGRVWAALSGGMLHTDIVQNPKLAFAPDGAPWVGCPIRVEVDELPFDRASVRRFSDGVWSTMGTGLPTADASAVGLVFAPDGVPWVVFEPYDGDLVILKLVEGVWEQVGASQSGGGATLAFAPDGVPHVAYTHVVGESYFVRTVAFNGTEWVEVGGAGLSGYDAVLAFAPDGAAWVAYQLDAIPAKTTVRRLADGAWSPVGPAEGISAGSGPEISLAFAPDGTAWIAYRDLESWNLTVQKFTAGAWSVVGNAIAAGQAYTPSLAFSPDGTAYVAYNDVDADQKMTVLRSSGDGTWSGVGPAGFTPSEAADPSLVFSPDGTPYVAASMYDHYEWQVMTLVEPVVTSVAVPTAGTYGSRQLLEFTVRFNISATVTGTPRLPLTVGSETRYATYAFGTGTSALVFRALVQPGDVDADGIEVGATIDPNGGTINGAADPVVLHDVASTAGVRVDATPLRALQAYLKASNTGANDLFGGAVAISGDTLVVGAVNEDSAATGVNGNQASNTAANAGAVYVFVRSGTTWSQQAYLKASNTGANDAFGGAVAISGDTIVVGARNEDSAATGVNGNQASNTAANAGAAYVFVRSGTTWSQQAYLKPSNTGAGDLFGTAVAICGDTVVVGATSEDSIATGVGGEGTDNAASNAGAAYVFVRSGTTWSQQAYLKASNTDAGDLFGNTVAISGDTIVVGAPSEAGNATGVGGNQADNSAAGAGAAYVFTRAGSAWAQQAYLKASNTDAGDGFGTAVAVDADSVVIGAPAEDSNATGIGGIQSNNDADGAGAAYVFARSGTTWSQQAYLKGSNLETGDAFGSALAVNGDTVVIGAPNEDSSASGVDGNQADDEGADAGAAYVFTGASGTWVQRSYLKAANPGATDGFAASVAISRGTIAAGARQEDSGHSGVNGVPNEAASSAGAAYVIAGYEQAAVTGVAVPAAGTHAAGQALSFVIQFSEPVSVAGSPQLQVVLGGETRLAAYVSGSGTASLVFRMTVSPGDSDPDGVTVGSLVPNVGTISTAEGRLALLALSGIGSTAGVLVDAGGPSDLTLSAGTVAEQQRPGAVVGTFTTFHPDLAATFTYALVDGAGGADNANFTIDGNTLRTAKRFDAATQAGHQIRVRTTDQAGRAMEKAFAIEVNSWASNFHLRGADGRVYAIAQDAGAFYYGGDFTSVGNVAASRVVRVDKLTGAISPLGEGLDDAVDALAVDALGNVYAGGRFTNAGENPASRVAKWNGESWSALGAGLDDSVSQLVISGGQVYAGGWFSERVARWDASAGVWVGLAGLDHGVNALAVDPAGRVYAGGDFTGHVARWDGSAWGLVGGGLDASVYVLAIDGSGAVFAGGEFSGVRTFNGAAWSAVGAGLDGIVRALAFDGSNRLVAGGDFTDCVARWDGTAWSMLGQGVDDGVHALAVSESGELHVGGDFSVATNADGSVVMASRLATWDDGWSAAVAGDGLEGGYVFALAATDDVVYVGGDFTAAGGVPANGVACWTKATRTWSALGDGLNGLVRALRMVGDDLYAGGAFTRAGGTDANRVAKWDGHAWSAVGAGLNGDVYALAATAAGTVYAGGAFDSTPGGDPNALAHIAKWSATESIWLPLGAGMNAQVRALAMGADGALYAGGHFTAAGGAAANHVAKYTGNGSDYAWSVLGGASNGTNDAVYSLAVNGTDLYVGGAFSSAGGVAASAVAKWDGSAWQPLGAGCEGFVQALAVIGSDLYAAGYFSDATDTIARWNGTAWSIPDDGVGAGMGVQALAVSDDQLFVGGTVGMAGGQPSIGVAAYQLPAAAVASTPATASNPTTNRRPVITGTAEAASTVNVYDGVTLLGTAAAAADGAWSFTPASDLGYGAHAITAVATAAGLSGAASAALTLTVEEPPPPQEPQTITFAALPDKVTTDGPFTVSATASSGLRVSFSVKSGPATISGNTVTLTGAPGTVTIRATQWGSSNYEPAPVVERSFTVVVAPPAPVTPPASGGSATLSAGTHGTSCTYQWQCNGSNLRGGTGSTLTLTNVQPANAGLYTYTVTSPDGTTTTSEPVIVGVATEEKVTGTGEVVNTDVQHPNGNTYDQLILEGKGATLTADSGKITRMSFSDHSNDIVQVEFSGAGSLSLVMDDASVPAPPVNYNQPGVNYVRGHVGIVITGADETTNLTVFSVGRVTAYDPTGAYDLTQPISATNDPSRNGNPLFEGHPSSDYDGMANVAFVAIQSTNGKFGGLRTGNVEYFAADGFTGVYAPGVEFSGPIYVGDIQAHDSAQPVLVVGSASDVRITGGTLFQPNGEPVRVAGLTRLQFTEGRTSQGDTLPAHSNQAVLQQDGVDITDLIIVGP